LNEERGRGWEKEKRGRGSREGEGKRNTLLRGFPPFLRREAVTGMFMFYACLDLLINANF